MAKVMPVRGLWHSAQWPQGMADAHDDTALHLAGNQLRNNGGAAFQPGLVRQQLNLAGAGGDRHLQDALHRHQLRGSAAGADLVGDVAHLEAAFGRDFDLCDAGLGAGAEVLLRSAEAHAVEHAGVGCFVLGLALGALDPQGLLRGQPQNLADAQMACRRGALGVLHAALEHVALTQLDRIQADFLGDLIVCAR